MNNNIVFQIECLMSVLVSNQIYTACSRYIKTALGGRLSRGGERWEKKVTLLSTTRRRLPRDVLMGHHWSPNCLIFTFTLDLFPSGLTQNPTAKSE
jgi:hypothetical protein